MKIIGLIGGLTWESSAEYYRLINEMVSDRLGGDNSAEMRMCSLNFAPVSRLMAEKNWGSLVEILTDRALELQRCGAECILICCNTLHLAADQVAEGIDVELINVIDVIGADIRRKGMNRVGLLGSSYTMKMGFYTDRLLKTYGIETILPDEKDMDLIMDIIQKELGHGTINASSKEQFLRIIQQMAERGAEGVILGCTEMPLLVKQSDTHMQLFDSTFLHSGAAVDFSLGRGREAPGIIVEEV